MHIRYDYHNNWILDDLPSANVGIPTITTVPNNKPGGQEEDVRTAMRMAKETTKGSVSTTHYSGGFPLGFVEMVMPSESSSSGGVGAVNDGDGTGIGIVGFEAMVGVTKRNRHCHLYSFTTMLQSPSRTTVLPQPSPPPLNRITNPPTTKTTHRNHHHRTKHTVYSNSP